MSPSLAQIRVVVSWSCGLSLLILPGTASSDAPRDGGELLPKRIRLLRAFGPPICHQLLRLGTVLIHPIRRRVWNIGSFRGVGERMYPRTPESRLPTGAPHVQTAGNAFSTVLADRDTSRVKGTARQRNTLQDQLVLNPDSNAGVVVSNQVPWRRLACQFGVR